MRLQRPVDVIDDVDVLFDKDVSRERLIEDPITDARFEFRIPFFIMPIEIVGVIEGLAQSDISDFAGVYLSYHRPIYIVVSLLEADMNAQFPIGLLACLDDSQGAGDIGRDRFFQIDMLARVDGGFQVVWMEIGWTGNQH